jgi:alkaline phosphatase D
MSDGAPDLGSVDDPAEGAECPRVRYQPNNDPAAGILGEAQWRWLASRLREPALLRILVSGIQVIPDGHCYEKWANFPRERARLFDLIRDSGVNGVVLVSGDRHLAEISMLPAVGVGHPLYELTTSGLNSAGAGAGESNPYRTTPDNFRGDNFGVIRLLREGGEPRVEIQVRNVTGAVVLSESVPLARLVPPRPEGGKTARGDLP